MSEDFTHGFVMRLARMAFVLSLFGGGPELTPEQKMRIELMEKDYERIFGRPLKSAKSAPKSQ